MHYQLGMLIQAVVLLTRGHPTPTCKVTTRMTLSTFEGDTMARLPRVYAAVDQQTVDLVNEMLIS
jgi:hypothetical protein